MTEDERQEAARMYQALVILTRCCVLGHHCDPSYSDWICSNCLASDVLGIERSK